MFYCEKKKKKQKMYLTNIYMAKTIQWLWQNEFWYKQKVYLHKYLQNNTMAIAKWVLMLTKCVFNKYLHGKNNTMAMAKWVLI